MWQSDSRVVSHANNCTLNLPNRKFATNATWFPWARICIPGLMFFPGSWVTKTKINPTFQITEHSLQLRAFEPSIHSMKVMKSTELHCAAVLNNQVHLKGEVLKRNIQYHLPYCTLPWFVFCERIPAVQSHMIQDYGSTSPEDERTQNGRMKLWTGGKNKTKRIKKSVWKFNGK